MIKKIQKIQDFATFTNFDWNQEVLNSDGSPAEFRLINVLYGRNYSGKTTISRLIRSLETGLLPSEYGVPRFSVEMTDGSIVSEADLKKHTEVIRVFNNDFIRENLYFLYNPDESINSFAIGSTNSTLEKQVKEKETLLGKESDGENESTGLYKSLDECNASLGEANLKFNKADQALTKKLDNKATKGPGNIKNNSLQYDINYNVVKLKRDIDKVLSDDFLVTPETEQDSLAALIKEEKKPDLKPYDVISFQLKELAEDTKGLVEKEISISSPIQDLLNDQLLEKWAKEGIDLHKGKRNKCGFCGNQLSDDLWGKLSNHFNQESESLRKSIQEQIELINNELKKIENGLEINKADFYSAFSDRVEEIRTAFKNEFLSYITELKRLRKLLIDRLDSISKAVNFNPINDNSSVLTSLQEKLEEIRLESNSYTAQLSNRQVNAKNTLRLNEVFNFVNEISYSDEILELNTLEEKLQDSKKNRDKVQGEVRGLLDEIRELKAQFSDEGIAAQKINYYLNSFFGHEFISIKSIRDGDDHRFEVVRNNMKAHHLSEGECSLIAFCYFMAKLNDIDTIGKTPIIWIDDPISSLDSNHIFFIFSLISLEIVRENKYKQLFVSTHNLDFFKYLRRLGGSEGRKNHREYFFFERLKANSCLKLMPNYIKKYATEFIYLFAQIYQCATAKQADVDNKIDCFYSYCNNVRKFLNSYLFYHNPNPDIADNEKLKAFLDDEIGYEILNRLQNEYSHLEENPERAMTLIDVPEMHKSAKFILNKINQNNPEQFQALCSSINVNVNDILAIIN